MRLPVWTRWTSTIRKTRCVFLLTPATRSAACSPNWPSSTPRHAVAPGLHATAPVWPLYLLSAPLYLPHATDFVRQEHSQWRKRDAVNRPSGFVVSAAPTSG